MASTADDILVDTTSTDASGYYLFDNLVPGTYFVQFVPPSGYSLTDADQGSDDTSDSDADLMTGRTAIGVEGARTGCWLSRGTAGTSRSDVKGEAQAVSTMRREYRSRALGRIDP